MTINDTLSRFITENRVILFMKGTADAPQCGFSQRAVRALRGQNIHFAFVDVLSSPRIREGLPKFSRFPTFPQLFVGGELIGGSDIVEAMAGNGELLELVAQAEGKSAPITEEAL